MHRHGYKGRKFGRERDQRRAMIKGLADALVLHESIETTWSKAKETARYTEKLVTKAKKGGLHNRRQVISSLATLEAANKLFDELAPKLGGRNSGYFRVARTELRVGDGAQLARVSFVDKLEEKPEKPAAKTVKAEQKPDKPEETKAETEQPRSRVSKESSGRVSAQTSATQAAKRTGRRGNR